MMGPSGKRVPEGARLEGDGQSSFHGGARANKTVNKIRKERKRQ